MTSLPKTARRPGALDRMVAHCVDRATDIEVTEEVAVSLGMRPQALPCRIEMRQLYLDMASLVDLVRMVEPEFRALVKKRLGEIRSQPAAPIAPPAEETGGVDGPADGVGATA